jgi:predicted nucleic acid-binding protein
VAAAKKPTVYLDTSILSSYWYEGLDILALGRRLTTREWWETERSHFTLWVSSVTEDELEAGHYPRQAETLAMARRVRFLPMIVQTREFAERLMQQHVVPDSKPGDALQMAIAAVYRMDYLLTWNYAHLANPIAQLQLETACGEAGWRAPLLVSPETIPRMALGQTIRRR